MSAQDTVEAVVRAKLSEALGGKRGMAEAAVPTLGFTISWIVTEQLRPSLIVGISAAVILLIIRLAQWSSPRFVVNGLIVIAIGAFFASRTGEAKDVYLPGILINAAYGAGMLISIIVRWPVVGLMIGAVTGDPSGWRRDPAMVKLCSRLTWILLTPNIVRLVVQVPIYVIYGNDGVAALGLLKIAMGWPLLIAALAAMVWLLARNHMPVSDAVPATEDAPARPRPPD